MKPKFQELLAVLLLSPRDIALVAVHGSDGMAFNVSTVDPDDWLQQCFVTFEEHCCVAEGDPHIKYSNFDLIAQPAGLCADSLACAFAKCDPAGLDVVNEIIANATDKAALTYDQVAGDLGALNLPAEMSFPRTVADVVAGLAHARATGRKVSVKLSGHSYAGSSELADSLQLNLRDLLAPADRTVVECADDASVGDDDRDACALARARGKDALIRVTGGETWSDVYVTLLGVTKEDGTPRYEAVGGAAGSVGAAGGWLQGGGWSYGPDRQYGLGVDQVLEMDMVLADGRHVRFGPTAWEAAEGFQYPKTTEVTGRCNAAVDDDEGQWEWGACADPVPNFADLWFAVRGGGGGTYGVVTSLKYQLHPQKPMESVSTLPDFGAQLSAAAGENQTVIESAVALNVWFLLKFLYEPETIGLTEEESVLCGSPALSFNPLWGGQLLVCYDNVFAEKVLPALNATVDGAVAQDPGLAPVAEVLKRAFSVTPATSYAGTVMQFFGVPGVHPPDRVPDFPLPNYTPDKGYGGWCSAQLPASWLAAAGEDVFTALTQTGGEHVTGGHVGTAQDQMSAVTPAARRTGLSSTSLRNLDASLQERILGSVLEDNGAGEAGSVFPGMTEANHVCVDSFGPLKADISKLCPEEYSLEQKEAECFSVQESIWGADVLDKLERIKSEVDPDNLFDCYPCVKPKKSDGDDGNGDGDGDGDGDSGDAGNEAATVLRHGYSWMAFFLSIVLVICV